MKGKVVFFLALVIGVVSAALLFAEQVAVSTENVKGEVCAMPIGGKRLATGDGNISIETDKVEDVSKQIQDLVNKHGAVMKSFNINTDSANKYTNAYVEASMDIALAGAFMNDVIALGNVKSNSYNEQTQPDNADDLNRQLAELNKKYEKIIQKQPDIEVSKALVSKIVEIENRIKNLQYSEGNEGKARIYISVQQKGQNREHGQKTLGIVWPCVMTAVVFLLLGVLCGNFAGRSQREKNQ